MKNIGSIGQLMAAKIETCQTADGPYFEAIGDFALDLLQTYMAAPEAWGWGPGISPLASLMHAIDLLWDEGIITDKLAVSLARDVCSRFANHRQPRKARA